MDTEKQNHVEQQKSEGSSEETPKFSMFLLGIAVSVNLIIVMAGMTMGWPSPVIPKLLIDDEENPLDHIITDLELSWFASSGAIGSILAAPLLWIVVEKFGRRHIMLAGTISAIISIFLLAFATTVLQFCMGQFFNGLGVGVIYTVSSLYLGEVSEPHNRGFIGCLISVSIGTGIFISYVIGPYLSIKVFTLLLLIPLSLFIITVSFFAPESPIFLAYVGKYDESKQNLNKFRKHLPIEAIEKEFLEITNHVNDNKESLSLKEFFTSKGLIRTMFLGSFALLMQDLCGYTSIITLLQTIFDASGSSFRSDYSADIVAGVHILTVFVTLFVIERLGKKTLLLTSCLCTGIILIVFGTYFFLKNHNYDVSSVYWLPVTCIVIFEITVHLGLGPIPVLLLGELFPSNSKALAVAVCTFVSYVGSFGISFAFPLVYSNFGLDVAFWIFSAFSFFGFLIIAVFFKDTKGKSLYEIQQLYKIDSNPKL